MRTHTQFVDPRTTDGFNLDPDRDTKYNLQKLQEKWTTSQPILDFKSLLNRNKVESLGNCANLLNTIFINQVFREKGKNKSVEIGCDSWIKSISHTDQKVARKDLIREGIISCDKVRKYGSYGSKAYCFEFTPMFWKKVQKLSKSPPNKTKCNVEKRKAKAVKYAERPIDPEEARLLDWMIKCHQKIKIDDFDAVAALYDELLSGPATEAISAFESFLPIIFGDALMINIKATANRYFCPLNRFPKKFRSYLKHEDDKELFSIDIATAYPTFMFGFYKAADQDERDEMTRYLKWLDHDFYQNLLTNVRRYYKNVESLKYRIPRSRPQIKEDFNIALNSQEWEHSTIRKSRFLSSDSRLNLSWQVFTMNFPILYDRMKAEVIGNKALYLSKRKDLCVGIGLTAVELQVMRPVYLELMEKGIWFNPSHDGVTVEKDGLHIAKALVEESLMNLIGFAKVTAETWIGEKPVSFGIDENSVKDDDSISFGENFEYNLFKDGNTTPYYGGFLDDVSLSSTVVAKPT
jgi:hypothetical protein